MLNILKWRRERKKVWESYCNHCGICCYEKSMNADGTLFIDFNSPCEYLDEKTKLCRIYENRFKINKSCLAMTWFRAKWASYLPPNCGYVERVRKKKK